jgi:N-acyl-D-amino-acid deacylase
MLLGSLRHLLNGMPFTVSAVLALFYCVIIASASGPAKMPVTGRVVAGFEPLDAAVLAHLERWSIPGASVAIAKRGHVIYSRGFGWADREHKVPVLPDSLFRVASISKSLTSVGVLKLCQDKKLSLDTKVFDVLTDMQSPGRQPDPRRKDITVRELLQCTGGWYKDDPFFAPTLREVAIACGGKFPPASDDVLRYWSTTKLDFQPGNEYGYSNFGYDLLGKIIERTAGVPYEDYIKNNVLKPMSLTRMQLGKTVSAAPGEVRYYPAPGETEDYTFLSSEKKLASWEYGGCFLMEMIGPAAGWIASTPDLLRFTSAIAGETPGTPLTPDSTKLMFAKPDLPTWHDKQGYFACGWEVYSSPSGMMFSRIGGMPGAVAFVVHKFDGTSWAVAFNSRSTDQATMMNEFKKLVWQSLSVRTR